MGSYVFGQWHGQKRGLSLHEATQQNVINTLAAKIRIMEKQMVGKVVGARVKVPDEEKLTAEKIIAVASRLHNALDTMNGCHSHSGAAALRVATNAGGVSKELGKK